MGIHENLTVAQRAARYRAAKRAQGMRRKESWIPDVRDPKVIEGIRRSVESMRAGKEEKAVTAWIDSLHAEAMADEPDYDWGPQDHRGDDPHRQ